MKTAVKNVLQTTSSAFSNKQNITDETCCVYRWSFPLSFSHLLWLCHHEPLGWSKNKSRLHKSPPPHVRCTWMQSSIVARLFTFIVFFFCLFFLQIELQLKKKRLLTHQLYHHTAVVLSVNCQHAVLDWDTSYSICSTAAWWLEPPVLNNLRQWSSQTW